MYQYDALSVPYKEKTVMVQKIRGKSDSYLSISKETKKQKGVISNLRKKHVWLCAAMIRIVTVSL